MGLHVGADHTGGGGGQQVSPALGVGAGPHSGVDHALAGLPCGIQEGCCWRGREAAALLRDLLLVES